MTPAEPFIGILEEKRLVPDAVIAGLRKQVAESIVPVSAGALAKRLVDRGLLTPFQAQQVLDQAAGRHRQSAQEEIGLAEEPRPAKRQPAPPVAPVEELKEIPPLEPIELVEGPVALEPQIVDEPRRAASPSAAKPTAAKGAPISAGAQQKLIAGVTPAKAAPAQAKPAPQPPAPQPPAPPVAKRPSPAPQGPRPASAQPPPIPEPPKPVPAPPGPTSRTPAAPPAGSLLDDEIPQPVAGSLGSGPLEGLMTGGVMEGAGAALGSPLAAPPPKRGLWALFRRRPKRPGAKENVWDSPLLLLGGGLLLLLVILGLVLLWSITRQSGDEMFELAEKDYADGSYTQAIHKYDQFLDRFPKHSGAGTARVKRGLARLRQATDGATDFTRSLDVAKEVIDEIKSESEFVSQGRPELTAMLPTIAEGLANQARKGPNPAELVEKAHEALGLVAKYVPKEMQPLSKLADIEASLALTSRKIACAEELQKGIAAIAKVAEEGRNAEAYAIRRALVKQYPVLIDNAKLTEAVSAVARAERSLVKMAQKQVQPISAEASTSIEATLVPVRRLGDRAIPDAQGQIVIAVHEGQGYGLDAATGKLLWRRAVGIGPNGRSLEFPPTPVAPGAASDVLLTDPARHEILRLEAATGRIRWRHPLGEPFDAHPVPAGGRLLVATRTGRLVMVDVESGASERYIQLPQELRVGPAVDAQQSMVYQVGEHSNLYVLRLADGDCKEVVYLGHEPGSVTVAPVICGRYLIVAVNEGAEEAALRVFALQAKADEPAVTLLQVLSLKGHVDVSPWVMENRILATTDRGEIHIFEIRGGNPKAPVVQVAQRKAAGEENMIRFPLLVSGRLWVGDSQLTRYDFHASRGELQPKWVTHERSVTLQPLVAAGQAVIQARRRVGFSGIAVSAVSMEDGQTVWETQLASRLAAEPRVDAEAGRITAVTSGGAVFQCELATLKADAFLDAAAAQIPPPNLMGPVNSVAPLDKGRMALASVGSKSKELFLVDPRAQEAKDRLRAVLLPDPLGGKLLAYGGGLLAPTAGGQVLLLDPVSGRNLVEPFQPRLEGTAQFLWRDAHAIGHEVLLADARNRLFRLGVKNEPKPHLAALAEVGVTRPIVSPVAAIDKAVYAVDSAGTVLVFQLPDLKPGQTGLSVGNCLWGPRRAGHGVMLASEDQVYCLDAGQKLLWKSALPAGPVAGPPLETGNTLVLAATSGLIWKIDAGTGKELARLDTGKPLATGPVSLGQHLLVGAYDGTLCRVKMP